MLETISVESSFQNKIASRIRESLQSPPSEICAATESDLSTFIFGRALEFIAKDEAPQPLVTKIWSLLCQACSSLKEKQIFWEAVSNFLQNHIGKIDMADSESQSLIASLVPSLESPSHAIRSLALGIFGLLTNQRDGSVPEILETASSIEDTEPTMESMRYISMQMRKLATSYSSVASDPWLSRAIPALCFGLLHVHLAPVWDDVCSALKIICDTKVGEDLVCEAAFRWLGQSQTMSSSSRHKTEAARRVSGAPGEFDSPEFDEVLQKMQGYLLSPPSADMQLDEKFHEVHSITSSPPDVMRLQALRALKSIPQYAEKRSRLLVPVLLNWVLGEDSDRDDAAGSKDESSTERRWTRKDQKAMLSLFAAFTNPTVLYKAPEVYSALLSLLEHGDQEIQKSALQAIFSWKNNNITRYQDDLFKFLEDSKFREQISVFLAIGQGEGSLEEDHRSDVMPIVLRLLYGRVITRGKGDQHINRRAVFGLVARLGDKDMNDFLNIALGQLSKVALVEGSSLDETKLDTEVLSQRKQFGLLNMLRDMLDTLKSTGAPYIGRLADPTIYCLIRAIRDLDSAMETSDNLEENSSTGLARSIRQISLQCLNTLFSIEGNFDWSPYLPLISRELVEPRVEKLDMETSQGVSGLLRFLATWSTSVPLAEFLVTHDRALVPKLADCVGAGMTKEEVKRFVLSKIFLPLIKSSQNSGAASELTIRLSEHTAYILVQIEKALRADSSKDLLEEAVDVLVSLADVVTLSSPGLLSASAFLIRQPGRRVRPDYKVRLLHIVNKTLPETNVSQGLFDDILNVVCSTFALGINGPTRPLLSEVTFKLADKDKSLSEVANLVQDLNSYSTSRLDEPDFARRSKAYSIINEHKYEVFSVQQWQLILSNALFYIKDKDELPIRVSASHVVRRFIEATARKENEELESHLQLLQNVVLWNVQNGLKDQPELVRSEYLSILNHIVRRLPNWQPTKDLSCLVGNHEESSFFFNILHIQQHRRLRTLGQLVDEAKKGHISSNNIAHLIIPILEHFVFSSDDGVLAAETMRSIGVLAEWMEFPQYRSLLRRYITCIKNKSEIQEIILKLVDATVTALCQSSKARDSGEAVTVLANTLPSIEKFPKILTQEFLPTLFQFLQEKDESVVSRRISVAIVTTRLLQLLPLEEFRLKFPPLLMDTCNILRSKDQHSRDMTRKALTTICSTVGPQAIGFVLRELKGALQRGFYLHVLSFTVHSILESTIPGFQAGDLDYCASEVVAIVMDDIFGMSGQEKEAAEFMKDKNTKKEVKGKKSFDTMQLLASVTTLNHLVDLVRPIEMLLLEKLNYKMLRNVDELLRRIELGVIHNQVIHDRDILVFCYQTIQDAYKVASEDRPSKTFSKELPLIPLTPRSKPIATQAISRQAKVGKVVRFALEIVRSVLKKNKSLKTPTNIAGFLPIIGDSLVQEEEEIKLAAIRLFTAIVGVPLPRIDTDVPVYIAEAVRIIEDSQGTNDELPQAALKLVASVLRDRKSVTVDDNIVALLLRKIKPDLQIISQQGVAFNLLRSIIGRRIIIPEVYAIIDGEDGAAAISVRDHDRTTRDLARGVYFQFLMDYPQGRGRFTKQLTFLVRNLEYEYPEGRQSVMETVNLLLTKIGDALVQELVRAAFWPVVSIMINDESSDCKEMASGLTNTISSRGR